MHIKRARSVALSPVAVLAVVLLGTGTSPAAAASALPEAAKIDAAALEAKYKADVFRRRAKAEKAVYEKVIQQEGFASDATDYLRIDKAHDEINTRKKAAQEAVNKLRAAGKLNSKEYYDAQAKFFRLQAMDYKNLSSGMDRRFNNYDSEWFGKYTVNEWMKGCGGDVKSIASDLWAKKWELLKTFIEKGPAEAVKAFFFETFDATYKVQFVKEAIAKHGATPRIAEFWWNHFVMGNFKKSNLMEIIEEVSGKASEKLQEKLQEKVTERIKEELQTKMMETGEKMTSEAVKKSAESAAKNWMKNFVTAPSILIEFTAKYWNVASFEQMFLEAAPNEAGYLKEIRRVLTSQKKLTDKEVDRCYFDRKYFLSLRRQLNLPKPTFSKPSPKSKNQKKGIQLRVTRHLQPEIDTVWEFVEMEEKVKKHVKVVQKNPPPAFDSGPFTKLVDKADAQLRTDAIDLDGYHAQIEEIQPLYDAAWNAWQAALLKDADQQKKAAIMQKTALERKKFDDYCTRAEELIQKDLAAYLAKLKAISMVGMQDRLKKTGDELEAKVNALWAGMDTRSMLLVNRSKILSCTKPDQLFGNNYEQFKQFFWPALTRSGIYQSIMKPEGVFNGLCSDLAALMMGEWFTKSVYDIWQTGTTEHMAMMTDIAAQEKKLTELLNPSSGLWRIQNTDGTPLPDVRKVIADFEAKAQRQRVVAGYNAFVGHEDFVYRLLRRQKVAEAKCKSRLRMTKTRVAAQAEELKEFKQWLNTEGQAIEDKGMKDWHTVCHEGLMALTSFTAGKSTPKELEETAKVLSESRLKYLARRKYLDDMMREAGGTPSTGAEIARNPVFNIEERFKTYLARYEVPERAVFKEVADGGEPVAPAFAMKVTTQGFEKRLAAYYAQPLELYKGVMVQRGNLPVMLNFRWLTQLQANLAQGDIDALASFAAIYRKGLKANTESCKAAQAKYIAFEKKIDEALGKPNSQEVTQALKDEWLTISDDIGNDFYKRIGTLPFQCIKFDKETMAISKRIHEKLETLRNRK